MNAEANAQMGLSQEVRQTTVVTFNPEHLEDMLDRIPKTIDDNANTTMANSGKKYDILCKLFIYYIAFCIISMSEPIETLTISTRGFG